MTNDKDSAVLLPCPFCGGQCAQLVIDQGYKWAHYEPSCLEVRTSYNVSEDAPWKAEAITAWNTRQPQTDALHYQLLRECLVKLRDVQGTQAPKQYACNLIKRIERVLQEESK
jgi:hypothetical protein